METVGENGNIMPTSNKKGGIEYYYYLAYVPTNHIKKVPTKFQKRRRMVWNFKNGLNSRFIANSLKQSIERLNLEEPLTDWWLCVVPASTKLKNKIRFKRFCRLFCENLEINNGYKLIEVKSDRKARHLTEGEEKKTIDIIDSLEFGNVNGKNILLFDDMITSGTTFLKVARELKRLGANKVMGLFLAKSFWPETVEELEK